jgi:hypothetical protein
MTPTAGHRRLDKEVMLQLIHPFFGDLMFDGIGLSGGVFVLVLMWDAWKDWKRAGVMRVRRRNRLPYSTGRRRAARGFFRKFRGRLVLLLVASNLAVLLVGGRQNPRGDKTSQTTPAGRLNPVTGNLSQGADSAHSDGVILTYQTLFSPSGTDGSMVNGNSNVVASRFRTSPDVTNGGPARP